MKRIKYLIMIILALAFSSSIFIACNNKLPTDPSGLIKEGSKYRVTYDGDGGDFSSARAVYMYFDSLGAKAMDPVDGNFVPAKFEQFISHWYRKETTVDPVTKIETIKEIPWDFKKDSLTEEIMVEKKDDHSGLPIYDLVLYPKWEYFLYIDYCVSYVEMDKVTYKGTLTSDGVSLTPDESEITVVTTDYKKQSELSGYYGRQVSHISGTAVPEDFDPLKHDKIKSANELMPKFYEDADLSKEITFPLDSKLAPKPYKNQNRVKVFVKFFSERYTVVATPNDLNSINNTNYYLWRDVDFASVDANGQTQKKVIPACVNYEGNIFLGNGFKLSNLIIECNQSLAQSNNMGIFGIITNSEISNVTFEDCIVQYSMSSVLSSKLGLLAGTVVGANTTIKNVHFVNTHGYVRSNRSSSVYPISYNTENYLFLEKDQNVPNNSISGNSTDEFSTIRYLNAYVNTPADVEGGFPVLANHDVLANNLSLEIGVFNAELQSRDLKTLFITGEQSTYYITLNIILTEINNVNISFFGEEYAPASSFGFETIPATSTAPITYALTIYVPEGIKAGIIAIKWDNDLIDEYKYYVFSGGGNLIKSTAFTTPGEDVTATYDIYSQTLEYTSKSMKYYVPTGEVNGITDRPEGYAVPVRLRLYARIAGDDSVNSNTNNFKDIDITIAGETYGIEELGFASRISSAGNFHYIDFWLPVSKGTTEVITVAFNDHGYSIDFLVKATAGTGFEEPPVAASAFAQPAAAPIAVLPTTKSKLAAI